MVLGTVLFWITENRREYAAERVMQLNTHGLESPTPERSMSVDPTAPPREALIGMPTYPGAVPHRVAETMRGQGGKMAVAWFSTPDSVQQVLEFYEATFDRLHPFYVSHRYSERSGYAGWLEPDKGSAMADAGMEMLDGVMHLASVLKEGNQTLVLLSTSRPLQILDGVARLPAGVVLPPWAETPKVFDLGEGQLAQTTLFSEVKEREVAEVDAWMQSGLRDQGWKIADHVSATGRTSLDFQRNRERLSVMITPKGSRVDLMVQYTNQPQGLTEGLQ